MEKQRYVVLDKNGKANIVQKADSRFVGIDEMAQHIAFDIIEDYKSIIDGDKKIEEMRPKADFFDAVADSKTAISMNEVSKVLGIKGLGRNNLFEFLRDNAILDRWNVPYQKYIDCGWFRVIEQKYTKNGEEHISIKTLVYQKGVDAIRRKIEAQRSA